MLLKDVSTQLQLALYALITHFTQIFPVTMAAAFQGKHHSSIEKLLSQTSQRACFLNILLILLPYYFKVKTIIQAKKII